MRTHLACINFLSATLLQLIRAAAVNPEAYAEAAAVRNSNQEVQFIYEQYPLGSRPLATAVSVSRWD